MKTDVCFCQLKPGQRIIGDSFVPHKVYIAFECTKNGFYKMVAGAGKEEVFFSPNFCPICGNSIHRYEGD